MTERRLRRRWRASMANGIPRCGEHGLGGRSPPLDRVADDADPVGWNAATEQLEDLVGDQLERSPGARPFEEPDGTGRIGPGRQPRRRTACVPGGRAPRAVSVSRTWCNSTTSPAASLARSSTVVRREANAARPGSYGIETVTSVRAASASSRRPLGARQILEPVGEDRRVAPRLELTREPVDGLPAHRLAIPRLQLVEPVVVGAVQLAEIPVDRIALDERGVELTQVACSASAKPAERAEAERPLRRASAIARRTISDRSAPVTRRRRSRIATRRSPRTDRRMSRSVRRGSHRGAGGDRVRPRRPPRDSGTISQGSRSCSVDVALQQERDFAGVRRSDDERKTHRSIVVTPFARSSYAGGASRANCAGFRRGVTRGSSACDRDARRSARASRPHSCRRDPPVATRAVRPPT